MNSATFMTRQQGKVLVYSTKGESKKKKCSHEAKSCNTSNNKYHPTKREKDGGRKMTGVREDTEI